MLTRIDPYISKMKSAKSAPYLNSAMPSNSNLAAPSNSATPSISATPSNSNSATPSNSYSATPPKYISSEGESSENDFESDFESDFENNFETDLAHIVNDADSLADTDPIMLYEDHIEHFDKFLKIINEDRINLNQKKLKPIIVQRLAVIQMQLLLVKGHLLPLN